MERREELLIQQLGIKEAPKAHKLKEQELIGKEVELIEKEIELIRSQIKRKSPIDEIIVRGPKKWYVVLNGPFPGIYDDWYKVAPHFQKIFGVTHRAYATKEEAEKALKDPKELDKSGNEIYLGPRTFSETIRSKAPERAPMKILGRIPSSLDDLPIISRKEHELQVQFSEEKFQENFNRLKNWTNEEKINCFYMVSKNGFGLKAVITPEASPILAFNMFQFGLIQCIYLSANFEEISLFPVTLKEVVQSYKRNIARERSIYLKFYSAYPDFSTNQPAMHFVQIGINNHQYPLMDEAREEILSEEQIDMIIANQLASIFSQFQSITKNSYIKVLSKTKNMVISSKTSGKLIHDKDMQLLTSFEVPLYSLNKELLNYKPRILRE